MASAMAVTHFFGSEAAHAHTRENSPYGLPLVENCENCKLRNGKGFCALSPAGTQALDDIKHTSSYPEGALIFVEGQNARGVHVLCQGRVKLQTTNRDGKTIILKIAEAGDVLGLHSVISGTAHEATAETLQPSQVAFVRREDFLKFLQRSPEACLKAAEALSRDCQSAFDVIRSIALSHSVSEKVARLLLHWAADAPVREGAIRVRLTLTHEEIAELIGSSRETVTRILAQFRKQKIAEVQGATLVLLDKSKLERLLG
jgi:CRP/FNR family cyclic AMP-dependent transcriptional regulator